MQENQRVSSWHSFCYFILMKENARNDRSTPRFVKHLAEAIILQSIEDLWDEAQRGDCLRFFRGNDFNICAEIAGLSVSARGRLLGLVNGLTSRKTGYPKGYPQGTNIEYSAGRG
jgi:predicted alpha-1,6-mannanase (GH76 family)